MLFHDHPILDCRPLLLSMTQSADPDEAYQDDHEEGILYTNNRTSCLTERTKRVIPLEKIRAPSSEPAYPEHGSCRLSQARLRGPSLHKRSPLMSKPTLVFGQTKSLRLVESSARQCHDDICT